MSGKAVHILLVDDNEDHVELMRRALDGAAFDAQLSVADSLAGAQRHLAEATPDIMITDYRLPDGEGTALLSGDADSRSMPIVILTGHGDETVAAAAIRAGALDYIVKSDDTLSDVAHIVERALREWGHIVEHRQAEEALRTRESQLALIYEHIHDIIFVVGVEPGERFRFISVNRKFIETTGLQNNQVIGKLVEEVIPEPSLAIVLGKYKEAIRNRKSVHWVETTDYPAGRRIGEVSVSPAFDAAGTCMQLIGTVHDITEREKAEAALKESEARYHDLYDNAPDMFASVEAATARIIVCNQTLASRLGYGKEEITGRPVFELYHDDCLDEVKKAFRSFVETGEVHDRELQLKTRDGEAVHVRLNASAVRDEHGEVLHSRSVWRDVSDTWKAEEELRKSKNRFVMAQTVGHVGIWEWDLRGDEVVWSDETYRILGLSPGERWPNLDLFLEYVREDERSTVRQAFVDTLHELESHSMDVHIVSKDGVERCVCITGEVVFDADQRPSSVVGTIQDISERKRNESALEQSRARLARAEGIGHIGNWSYDAADGNIRWSDEVWRIFGREPQSTSIAYELLRPWLREDYRKFHDDVMQRMSQLSPGESIAPYEFCLVRPDGEERWVSVTQEVEFDASGKPARFFGIAQDVTDRKLTEDALKRSEKKYRLLFENMTTAFALHEIICDEHGKPVDYRFVEANPAFERLTGIPVAGLAGKSVRQVLPGIEPAWIETFGKVALTGEPAAIEQFSGELNRHYDVWAFSPRRGQFATIFNDITGRKRRDMLMNARLRLTDMGQQADYGQLMQATLDAAEKLTGSSIGFFHFVEEDQENISLQAWSSNTIEHMCTAEGAGNHYPVSQAGVWADAIRQRKAVIHNDYAHLEGRKGMPEGHAAVLREVCIPILRQARVVAVLGVGNKALDYDDADIDILSQLASLAWDMIDARRAERLLRESRQHFTTLFEAVTDAVYVHPLHDDGTTGNFIEVNDAACKLSGFTRKELLDMGPVQLDAPDSGTDAISVGVRLLAENSAVFEQVHVARGGRRIPVEVHANLFELDGQKAVFSLVRDISGRKRIETTLRRERDFASSLVRTAQMIVLVLNPDASIRFFNPYMEAVSGFRLAEVKGKNWFETFISEQDRDTIHELFDASLAGRPSPGNVNAIVTRDGGLRQIEWYDSVLRNPDGQLIGLLAIGQDITERKQAGERLKQLERRYRSIVENSFVPHALNDEDENITYLNPAFVETFGYTLEDIPTLDAWWTKAYPDPGYRQWVSSTWRAGMQAARGDGIRLDPIELTIRCKDGSVRTAMVGAASIGENYAGEHLVTLFDITEEKRAREIIKKSQRVLAETEAVGRVGGWVINTVDNSTVCTAGAYDILEVEKAGRLSVSDGINFFTPESRPVIQQAVDRAIKHGEPFDLELEVITAKGNHCNVHAIGKPDLEHNRVYGFFQDITERRHAEMLLQESENRYRELIEGLHSEYFLYQHNAEGVLTYISTSVEDVLGFTPEEMRGQSYEKFVTDNPINQQAGIYTELAFKGERQPSYEMELCHKNGDAHSVEVIESPVFDRDGKVIALEGICHDITKRRQMEKDLIESEHKLQEAQKVARIGYYLLDINTGTWSNSTGLDDLFGIDDEYKRDVAGWLGIVHPDDRESMKVYLQKDVLSGHKKFDKEYRIINVRTKQEHWVHGLGELKFDDEGHAVSMLGTIQDITKRKLAQNELEESRALMNAIVEKIPAMVFLKRAEDLSYALFNKAGEELLGYDDSELIGKTDHDFFEKEQADFFIAKDREVLDSHRLLEVQEEPITTRDGKTKMLHTVKTGLYDRDGSPTYLLGISMDITELKQLEAELQREKEQAQTYLDVAGVMMVVLDASGNIRLINRRGCEVLGYDEQEVTGKNWFELFVVPDKREEVRDVFKKLMSGELESVEYYENTVLTKSGEERWMAFHNTSLRDDSGNINGIMFSGEDITDKRLAEDRLKKRFDEIERMNELMVGRELKMEELRQEIKRLKGEGR